MSLARIPKISLILLAAAAVVTLALGVLASRVPLAPGPAPHDAAALGVKDTLYALTTQTGEVVRLAPDGTVIARVTPNQRPAKLALVADLDGTREARAITVAAKTNLLTSFDARRFEDPHERLIDIKAVLVAPSPDGLHLAIGDTGAGVVLLLDAVTLEEVARADDLVGVHDLRFSEHGDQLYASTLGSSKVVAFDAPSLEPTRALTIPGLRYGIDHTVRTPDGTLGFAVSPVEPQIYPIAMDGGLEPLRPIALGTLPYRAFMGPLGDTAWLPSITDPTLLRLDLSRVDRRPVDRAGLGEGLLAPNRPGTERAVASATQQVMAAPQMMAAHAEISDASPDGLTEGPGAIVQTIPLGAAARTLGMEPFATTLLVATLEGLERVSADGVVLERIAMPNPVVRILPLEGAVVSLLVHADGSLSRQHAHGSLAPEPLADAPPLFAASTASALAFCHN